MEFDLQRYKSKLLDVLVVFDRTCRENSLRYSIVGGTLIGAVRHKGYIPWDDDADVIMPRPDYDKLVQILELHPIEGYGIVNFENTKNYPQHFSKFVDTNTTLIESEDMNNYILGVNLDIFPLDGVPDSKLIRRFHLFKINWHRFCVFWLSSKNKHVTSIKTCMASLYCCFSDLEKELRRTDKLMREFSFAESKTVRAYAGIYKDKEYIPQVWFDSFIDLEFERHKLMAISEYHKYLTQFFGDYMQLPPVEKRVSLHEHYFIDLNRRLSEHELETMGYYNTV